jgi:hypothetical protein
MPAMTDVLEQMLGEQADRIGAQIGADEQQTRAAISAAIPSLIAALSQEADRGSGLRQAIAEDHDGAIIDNLPGYLEGTANLSPRTTDGAGILEHVFGGQQPTVERTLSSRTGLSLDSIAQLLPILAPIVMGMLGKQTRSSGSSQTGSSGFGLDDLGSLLGGEAETAKSQYPEIGDLLAGLGQRR